MREIKFRAWNPLTNKWLHGYDVHKEGCSLIGETINCGLWLSGVRLENYNDIIIEQFTGLHDKNGKEIYEGDILATSNSNPKYDLWEKEDNGYTTVMWSEEYNCWTANNWVWIKDDNSIFDFEFIQIIGNIHENPELLEK